MGATNTNTAPAVASTYQGGARVGERTCTVEGCDRTDRIKRGMCNKHYQRFAKYGTATLPDTPRCEVSESYRAGERRCGVDGCQRPHYGRGWCHLHYKRMWKTGSTDERVFVPKPCAVDGCDKQANVPGSARGWCAPHYQRWQRWGDPLGQYEPTIGVAPCAVEDCDDLVKARGWCSRHWERWSRHGHPTARRRGEIVDGRRICPTCGIDKPLAEYGKSHAYCKPCTAARTAAYRVRNPPALVQGWLATCECCGANFMANKKRSKHCGPECSEESLWKYAATRRSRLAGRLVEVFDRREIFDRDSWTCQICGQPVDPDAPRYSYSVPSIDHIIPIARGGEHSRANVQTACLGCNVRKGDRVA